MKVGFVTIIGKPNAGKSTLVNHLVGEKVSIVTWKPQTTRNMISGIITTKDYQIVLVDTPGLHNAKTALSKYMMRSVEVASSDVDLMIYVVNGAKPIHDEEIKGINEFCKNNKIIIVVNKLDEAEDALYGENFKKLADNIVGAEKIIPISALKGKNLDVLIDEILPYLKEGVPHFSEDEYTDKSVNFMIAEIVREKALKNLSQELPYGIGVKVNSFSQREDKPIVDIDVEVYCEKSAHKSIIIGKGGEMLKKISSEARIDIERLIDTKVFLTIWIKVKPDWRESELLMSEIGYNKKDFQ